MTNTPLSTNDGGFAAMLVAASNSAPTVDLNGTNFSVEVNVETNQSSAEVSSRASSEFQAIEQWCITFLSECSPLDVDDNFADPDMTFDFSQFVSH